MDRPSTIRLLSRTELGRYTPMILTIQLLPKATLEMPIVMGENKEAEEIYE